MTCHTNLTYPGKLRCVIVSSLKQGQLHRCATYTVVPFTGTPCLDSGPTASWNSFIFFNLLFTCVCWGGCGGQRRTCGSQFFPLCEFQIPTGPRDEENHINSLSHPANPLRLFSLWSLNFNFVKLSLTGQWSRHESKWSQIYHLSWILPPSSHKTFQVQQDPGSARPCLKNQGGK